MSEESKQGAPGGASPVCEICGRERVRSVYTPGCLGPAMSPADCYRLGYERLRASLSTAEKELIEKCVRAVAADERTAIADAALDKAEKESTRLRGIVKEQAAAFDARHAADMAELATYRSDSSALEKALGALRVVLDTTCDDHADMCCVEWCGRCQDEAVARKAGYAILSGGAHVDGPLAQTKDSK